MLLHAMTSQGTLRALHPEDDATAIWGSAADDIWVTAYSTAASGPYMMHHP